MSWLVRNTIMYSSKIRSGLYVQNDGESYTMDFDSVDYNNLLTIEKKVFELYNDGKLSDLELNIMKGISNGLTIEDLSLKYNKSRFFIRNMFNNSCEKVAFYLGGEFTDDGYVEYMRNKYKLTVDQANKMIEAMNRR